MKVLGMAGLSSEIWLDMDVLDVKKMDEFAVLLACSDEAFSLLSSSFSVTVFGLRWTVSEG